MVMLSPWLAVLLDLAWAGPRAVEADRRAIVKILDALHRAATEADEATYFALFRDDARFVGTDATEVWDLAAFRAYAAPHFAEAPAWGPYTPVSRQVDVGPRRRSAWFHEQLTHPRYGTLRGSGTLLRRGGDWRIAQYVLSFPVPNDVAPHVVALVQEGPGSLPPPFTAAAIRRGCGAGRAITTRTTRTARSTGEGGEEVRVQRTTFEAERDGQAIFRVAELDAEGAVVKEHEPVQAPWEALRDHAAFPAGATWAEERIAVPAGTYDTRRYTVSRGTEEHRFWFSLAHPGPPVKHEVREGGRVQRVSEWLADRGPEPLQ